MARTPMYNRMPKSYRRKLHPAGKGGLIVYIPSQYKTDWDVSREDKMVIRDNRDGTLTLIPERMLNT